MEVVGLSADGGIIRPNLIQILLGVFGFVNIGIDINYLLQVLRSRRQLRNISGIYCLSHIGRAQSEVSEASSAGTSCEGRRSPVDLRAEMPEEHGEGSQQPAGPSSPRGPGFASGSRRTL